MLWFTLHLRLAACIAIGALVLAWGQSTAALGCHRGGTGGGYNMGGYPYGAGSQYNSYSQQGQSSSANTSLNNPATVMAYEGDLKLTGKQVQALEKMAKSGKQHAALVLTSAQRKQLAGLVKSGRASGSVGTSASSTFGTSSLAGVGSP